MLNLSQIFEKQLKLFFEEDDMNRNLNYLTSLPAYEVKCHLKIKDDLILAGLPIFFEVFNYLLERRRDFSEYMDFEGKEFAKKDLKQIDFSLPFNVALSGERLALNLLQRASSVATYTHKFVKAAPGLKVLDTRKTTPGLRFLEKYAVTKGGGYNHRFSQMDTWMVKDNHKTMFGGVVEAIHFFKDLKTNYQPIVVEIHDLEELKRVAQEDVTYFMLDNFSKEDLHSAIEMKQSGWHYEVSGGITLDNIKDYCVEGIDAVSTGSIIYNAPQVDLSLKFSK